MEDGDSEPNIDDLVKAFGKLASKKEGLRITGPHTGHAKYVKDHKEVSKYHGKDDIGAKEAREIGARIMEEYHRKQHNVTGKTAYEGNTNHWMSFAKQILGDNYQQFLDKIEDGDVDAAVELLKDTSGQRDVGMQADGLAQKVTTLSPERREEWAKRMGKKIEGRIPDGSDFEVDYAKLQENPETALTYLRQLQEIQKPLRKPKRGGKYIK